MSPRGIVGGKRGRPRAFIKRDGGVWVEDINIAASLLCYGEMKINEESRKDYSPGTFFGVVVGKDKKTEQPIFMFDIRGDAEDLCERKRLWFAGAYRMHPREHASARNYLMTALRGAMEDAKVGRKIIPMKETVYDGKIQGEDNVPIVGNGKESGGDGGPQPDSCAGTDGAEDETVGAGVPEEGGRREEAGSGEEVAAGGDA